MKIQLSNAMNYLANCKIFYRQLFLPTKFYADFLTLSLLPSAYAKSTVFLRVPSLTKVQVPNFLLLLFPRWLCLIHGEIDIYLRHVKRSIICKCQYFCLLDIQEWSVFLEYLFLCYRRFPLEEIQLSVACYVSILNFNSPKYMCLVSPFVLLSLNFKYFCIEKFVFVQRNI